MGREASSARAAGRQAGNDCGARIAEAGLLCERGCVQEAVEHVPRDARDVVVVIVVE